MTGPTVEEFEDDDDVFAQEEEEDDDYYDEIEIEDMHYIKEKRAFFFPCPCGDKFWLTVV